MKSNPRSCLWRLCRKARVVVEPEFELRLLLRDYWTKIYIFKISFGDYQISILQLISPYFRKIISYSIITFYYLSLGWTWWFCVFRIFLNLFCKIRIFLEYLVKSKSQKNSEIAIIQMVIPVTFLPNKIFCSPLPSSKVWDFWKNNSLSGCP